MCTGWRCAVVVLPVATGSLASCTKREEEEELFITEEEEELFVRGRG